MSSESPSGRCAPVTCITYLTWKAASTSVYNTFYPVHSLSIRKARQHPFHSQLCHGREFALPAHSCGNEQPGPSLPSSAPFFSFSGQVLSLTILFRRRVWKEKRSSILLTYFGAASLLSVTSARKRTPQLFPLSTSHEQWDWRLNRSLRGYAPAQRTQETLVEPRLHDFGGACVFYIFVNLFLSSLPVLLR